MNLSDAKESFTHNEEDVVNSNIEETNDILVALELLQKFLIHGEELIETNREFRIFSNEERGKLLSLCGEAALFLDQWNMGDLDDDNEEEDDE